MSASPATHIAGMGTPHADDVLEATRALAPDERKRIAKEALRQLSRDDQDDITESFRPGRAMTDWIWLIVVTAFATVLVGSFTTLALSVFVSEPNDPAAQTILTMFTSVVGFLAGLFVPSPINKNGRE